MRTPHPLADGLREIIATIVEGVPTHHQVRDLAVRCHTIASVFLRHRVSALSLDRRFHIPTVSDLAYDCIAELFRSDISGSLPQFKRFFGSMDYRAASNEALLSHLHRLVFSSAQQGLVRIYSDADRSLARILRGLRGALRAHGMFTLIDRFGEQYLVPLTCEPREHLPEIDHHQLEAMLFGGGASGNSIPDLLERLVHILKDDRVHCRMVSLLTVALAIKSLYRNGDIRHVDEEGQSFLLTDSLAIIRRACREILQRMRSSYVVRKAVPQRTYEFYGQVVEESVVARLTGEFAGEVSLYERLASRLPGLTREEYSREHRSRLEYLTRLAEELSKKHLKQGI